MKLRKYALPFITAGALLLYGGCQTIKDVAEENRKMGAAADSARAAQWESRLKLVDVPSAKLLYFSTGVVSGYFNEIGVTHQYQMATFKFPNNEMDLLIPIPESLVPNKSYELKYEPLPVIHGLTAHKFFARFFKKEISALPDYRLSGNLDGIVHQIKPIKELR